MKAGVDKWTAANPAPHATIADVADHVDHIRKAAGIDHIGIGGDFDGITQTVKDLDNVSTYPRLTAELLRRGYSDADMRKILGLNVLRVDARAEKVSKRLQRSAARRGRVEVMRPCRRRDRPAAVGRQRARRADDASRADRDHARSARSASAPAPSTRSRSRAMGPSPTGAPARQDAGAAHLEDRSRGGPRARAAKWRRPGSSKCRTSTRPMSPTTPRPTRR